MDAFFLEAALVGQYLLDNVSIVVGECRVLYRRFRVGRYAVWFQTLGDDVLDVIVDEITHGVGVFVLTACDHLHRSFIYRVEPVRPAFAESCSFRHDEDI